MNIPLSRPTMTKKMIDAAGAALRNERLVLGESVTKFEEEFARYCGTKYAVSTSSGTDALIITFRAVGVYKKDVITTPFTFIASSNAVIYANGRPRFADIEERTCNLEIEGVKKKLRKDTGAVMPVHLYGNPCDMDRFMEMQEEHKNLYLVEDACQAHGAEFKGMKVGSIGDVGCFSFYPIKNMTVGGDGGMITTNHEGIAETCRKLRDCGRETHYTFNLLGYTARLNTANAAIGREQLKMLDEWNERRRKIRASYVKELKDLVDIRMLMETEDAKPVYHLMVIRTKRRDDLRKFLKDKGVETGVHYPIPVHLQSPYVKLYHFKEGAFPVAEACANEVLSLPMYPDLRKDDVKYVCESIRAFFKKG